MELLCNARHETAQILGSKTQNSLFNLLTVLLSNDIDTANKAGIWKNNFDITLNNETGSEATSMYNLSEDVEAKGRAEGRAEAIRDFMESANITAEKAVEILKIPAEERPEYRTSEKA